MDNKVLGKGLSALIPGAGAEKALTPDGGVTEIKTSLIKDNSLQPRTHYDEAKLAELVASIKEKGILQPILVRKLGAEYEVIAGERRLRAARALNLESIPAVVKVATDREALVLALVENIQREELNAIEEAQSFRKLIDEFNFSQEDVAKSIGKDRSTVNNLLRLLKLPEEIQKAVFAGQLSTGHARALLAVEDKKLQNKIFNDVITNGLSVREVERLVKAVGEDSVLVDKTTKPEPKNQDVASLEEDLQRSLGTKVRVLAKNKKGKIVIEYYSLEDLDRIIGILKK
jgi:ParB family transcriptional regulator, chromosome partitioning protein